MGAHHEQSRFSPAPALTRGSNQTILRAYNERLVLSTVRRHGSMAKADIARATGLSAQTISVIMRALEVDDLLLRQAPVRGRVGQPSVPMAINPRGVFSIGLKVGRRAADIILIDFLGNILLKLHHTFDVALPAGILAFVVSAQAQITAFLDPQEQQRIAGIGIAAPFELWNWAHESGANPAELAQWQNFDLAAEIAALVPYPVFLQNDATSACGAELVFGQGPRYADFIYFYLGSFVGGGVVINGNLHLGKTGNAGALGSMLVPAQRGAPQQLITSASIIVLEKMLKAQGVDPRPLWHDDMEWVDFGAPLDNWIAETARALAYAIVTSCSVIEFEAAIIEGNFPVWVRQRIVSATQQAMLTLNTQGLIMPQIREGRVGPQARAIGGASLPLFARYLLDLNILFKETTHAERD